MVQPVQPMVDYLMNEWQLSREQTIANMKKLGQEKYLNTDTHGNPLPPAPKKPSKFWGTVKLVAQCRFADAVEYSMNGDTEN